MANERGFTLLLASLISSIVLAVGISIFTLAQKAITLSSIGRDSQIAFYAADTAAECALYWDVRWNYFATTTPSGVSPTCDGQAVNMTGHTGSYPDTMAFTIEPNGLCATVTITKSVSGVSGGIDTVIRGDGFNTNCASISTSDRSLQRSVELHY